MVAMQLGAIKQTMATLSALIRHLLPTTHGSKPAYVHSLGLRPHPYSDTTGYYLGHLTPSPSLGRQSPRTPTQPSMRPIIVITLDRGQRSDIKHDSITYMNVGVV